MKLKENEDRLVCIAESHLDDDAANAAMKKLKEQYDSSYRFCLDCDGKVVKDGECCLYESPVKNREKTEK